MDSGSGEAMMSSSALSMPDGLLKTAFYADASCLAFMWSKCGLKLECAKHAVPAVVEGGGDTGGETSSSSAARAVHDAVLSVSAPAVCTDVKQLAKHGGNPIASTRST